jgi:L-cystine transport system permease protein
MIRTLGLSLLAIPVTLQIVLVTLGIALPLGFFMALARIYRVKILKELITFCVSFIRGTPVVLQILIVYSLVPSLLNAAVKKLGLGINVFDLNPIIYACLVFTINSSAGLSEVFRSALLTVDKGQLEAALATGLSPVQAYRRIILPQALIAALPNICNLSVGLIKSTSLAFIMTVKDITAVAKIAASYGYNYIEAYLDIFLVYILVCSVIQRLFNLAEGRLGIWRERGPGGRGRPGKGPAEKKAIQGKGPLLLRRGQRAGS